MDENELNRIDLSEEQRRDIEEGNVEIASGTTGGSGSSRKKGAGRFLVFLLGILMGVAVTGVACIFMILIPAAKERKQLETANEKEVLHSDEVLKKIDRLKARLSTRVRGMYKSGNTSFIDIIFGSTSFASLVNNVQLLNEMNQDDADMVVESRALKAQIEEEKIELERLEAIAEEKRKAAEIELGRIEGELKQKLMELRG